MRSIVLPAHTALRSAVSGGARPPVAKALPNGLSACLLSGLLAGCAGFGHSAGPVAPASSNNAATTASAAWQAPLPHQGQLGELTRWWQQFDDPAQPPVLAPLVDAAEAASPSVSTARARIEQARATRVAAGAALGPQAELQLSAQRSSADRSNGFAVPFTRLNATTSVAWELDLFGGNAAARDAAQARLEGAEAQWHAARVAVAAEVANQYNALRACDAQVAQTQLDVASRAETARLTELSAHAGFQAPANAALARASAAQGRALLTQQQAQCDSAVKALVALTARDEPALRQALAAARGQLPYLPPAPLLALPEVPAALLRQRPDLANAEREVRAAAGDVGQARAALLPSIQLVGSVGTSRLDSRTLRVSNGVWSVGPVTVSLPLFDGGANQANLVAARARYDDAGLQYAATLRTAVSEVEQALVALDSASRRAPDLQTAADGFATSLRATDARQKGGLASLFELEDARRSSFAAQAALIDAQRDRVAAWIALYRALGGGWNAASQTVSGARGPHPDPLPEGEVIRGESLPGGEGMVRRDARFVPSPSGRGLG